jgi:hypothetical protein
MAHSRECDRCGNAFHISAERCPHCAFPSLFPNVFAAEKPGEREALDKRYNAANVEAESRGAGDALRAFESALTGSRVVLARSAREVLRLATADNEIYGTFYGLVGAGYGFLKETSGIFFGQLLTVHCFQITKSKSDLLRYR